jgi:tRNA(fMet)-specific endonuclease VapC
MQQQDRFCLRKMANFIAWNGWRRKAKHQALKKLLVPEMGSSKQLAAGRVWTQKRLKRISLNADTLPIGHLWSYDPVLVGYWLDCGCSQGQDRAVKTVLELAPSGLAVSIITYGELYEGAAFAHDPQPALAGWHAFLKGKDMLPLTTAVMERFANIRGSLPRQIRQQIGDLDILIAATCLEHDLTLLTRNLKDFHQIPNLKLYQPN